MFELCPSDDPVEIVVKRFDQPNKPSEYDSDGVDSHTRAEQSSYVHDYNLEFVSEFQDNFTPFKRVDDGTLIALDWPVDQDDNGSNENSGSGGDDNNSTSNNGSSDESGSGRDDNSSSDSSPSRFSGGDGDDDKETKRRRCE